MISLEERLDNTILRLVHFKPVYNTHREGLISNENNSKLFEKMSFQVGEDQVSLNKNSNLERYEEKFKNRRLTKHEKNSIKSFHRKNLTFKNLRSIGKKSGKRFARKLILKRRE